MERTKKEIKKYQLEVISQMLKLATSGFGLVAALAWNDLIKSLIDEYVKAKISVGSGIITAALYAIIVTLLAVFITLQLSKIKDRVEENNGAKEE